MKQAAILVALLLTLPFLECICSNIDHIDSSCQNCDDSSHLPNTSHDCLDSVEYFALQEILFQSFGASMYKFSTNKDVELPNALLGIIEYKNYCWFGKLKPHLALKILQV